MDSDPSEIMGSIEEDPFKDPHESSIRVVSTTPTVDRPGFPQAQNYVKVFEDTSSSEVQDSPQSWESVNQGSSVYVMGYEEEEDSSRAKRRKVTDRDMKILLRNEEVLCTGEDIAESYLGWRMFFNGETNFKGVGNGAVLISESEQHYPPSAKIRFPCTNNMAEYEACILGIRMEVDLKIKELLVIGDSNLLIHQVQGEWTTKNVKILPYLHCVKELYKKFTKIDFKHIPRIQNKFSDSLATLSSMTQYLYKN
ncbi:uncharacterized protein [Nicotiana sylvestris]|uniref:uncharacterized protein n=1 Tax=Nicotiana sylvestris TaxID=4096 RepID=UPI00388CE0F9